MDVCVCGSGLEKSDCCLKTVAGKSPANTAEALMRSRYTAYVMANEGYLLDSWHKSTRPSGLDLSEPVEWLGLQVKQVEKGRAGDREGWVEFIARYQSAGRPGAIHERSRFVYEQGQWFYVDGELIRDSLKPTRQPGRNAACPCGSGKKFKRCCGAG